MTLGCAAFTELSRCAAGRGQERASARQLLALSETRAGWAEPPNKASAARTPQPRPAHARPDWVRPTNGLKLSLLALPSRAQPWPVARSLGSRTSRPHTAAECWLPSNPARARWVTSSLDGGGAGLPLAARLAASICVHGEREPTAPAHRRARSKTATAADTRPVLGALRRPPPSLLRLLVGEGIGAEQGADVSRCWPGALAKASPGPHAGRSVRSEPRSSQRRGRATSDPSGRVL